MGTGGYACFPVLTGGQNDQVPSLSARAERLSGPGPIRTLEKHVDNIFLGFAEAGRYFKQPQKHIVSGNPVRRSFFNLSKREARERLGIPQDDFVVFTFGGSLGSIMINDIARELLALFNGHAGVTMIIGTGKYYRDEVYSYIRDKDISVCDNIRIKEYIESMDLPSDVLRSGDKPCGARAFRSRDDRLRPRLRS